MMPTDNAISVPSAELIDEAQTAVIKAVDNVSEMISETTQISEFSPDHHTEFFYKSPEFWVGMAFVLVVVALSGPIGKMVKKALSGRRQGIIDRINEAEKLRDDAQMLLAQYERKFLHAKDEAKQILDKSNAEIKNLTEYELQKMEKELAIRQKEVDMAIDATIEKTKAEIKELASKKSVNMVKKYVTENLTRKQHEKLIDNSIKNILNALK
ncbi:MAG: hypothetical protein E7016_04495 [Alphaproteobacteria bacterium]|nr:hypothetical protein [Alphaproteobacteria bacterium]